MDIIIKHNCNNFITIDETKYNLSSIQYIQFIDFLCYFPYNAVSITSSNHYINHSKTYTTSFNKDGRYIYYKIGVPTLDHPTIYNNAIYLIKNKVFYYQGDLYYGLENVAIKDEVVANSRLITNWYEIINLDTFEYHYEIELFTFWYLTQCAMSLQYDSIMSALQQCNMNKCENNNTKLERDFLFSTIYVLDYLSNTKNYYEAQRIIEGVQTCTSLCKNIHTNNICDCNG